MKVLIRKVLMKGSKKSSWHFFFLLHVSILFQILKLHFLKINFGLPLLEISCTFSSLVTIVKVKCSTFDSIIHNSLPLKSFMWAKEFMLMPSIFFKKRNQQFLLTVWLVRISDYGVSMLFLNSFRHNTIEISLWIELPEDLIIRYCFFGIFLKIKFCKTLYMLDHSFFVSMDHYWVRIITEHECFHVKKLKWKKNFRQVNKSSQLEED